MAAIQQFAPINYAGMQPLQDPSAGFLRGLQMVQAFQAMGQEEEARKLQMAKMAADAEKAKQEAERRAAYQSDIASAFKDPTHEAFAALTAKYPDQREALSQSWGMLSKPQQDAEFLAGSQAFVALQNGNTDAANGILGEQIMARKNSGKDASKLEAMRSIIEADPKRAAAQLGFVLSSVDPDRWAKMGEEMRKSESAPDTLRKLSSEATIKEIEAQFAPDKYALELKQQRAELVKTANEAEAKSADRLKTLAEIRALDEKAKMLADGKIPPEDRAKAEDEFRKEYLKNAEPMIRARDAFRRIQVASPNAAGDLALVIGFNKLLDEGSVVKESEAEIVRNARGVATTLATIFERVKNGDTLDEGQRKKLKAESAKLMGAIERNEKEIRAGITRIAEGRGLKAKNIFYDPSGNLANAAENEGSGGAPVARPTIMSAATGLPVAPDATTAQTIKKGDW